MHELLEAHCPACSFSVRGLDVMRASKLRECRVCGLPLMTRSNLNVSRRLPGGMALLLGAFAASLDASPISAEPPSPGAGFARRHNNPEAVELHA